MTPPAAAASAGPRARAAAPARPLTRPTRPRRVSGPSRRGAPSSRPERTARERGIALGLIAAISGAVQSSRLDRLIRGRGWIALVAFALIGIVTLQLGLLKLNAGMGRAIERAEALQRQNSALAIENSQLSAGSRVEALAAKMGMVVVPSGATRFLHAGGAGQDARAAAAITAPSSSATSPASTPAAETRPESAAASSEATSGSQSSGGSEAATSQTQPGGETPATAGGSQGTPQSESTTTPAPAPGAAAGSGEAAPAGGTQAGPAG